MGLSPCSHPGRVLAVPWSSCNPVQISSAPLKSAPPADVNWGQCAGAREGAAVGALGMGPINQILVSCLGKAALLSRNPWCDPLPGVGSWQRCHQQTASREPDPLHQNISLITLQTCLAKQREALSRESACGKWKRERESKPACERVVEVPMDGSDLSPGSERRAVCECWVQAGIYHGAESAPVQLAWRWVLRSVGCLGQFACWVPRAGF